MESFGYRGEDGEGRSKVLVFGSQELPTARLVIEPQGSMAKYRLEGDVTEAWPAAKGSELLL